MIWHRYIPYLFTLICVNTHLVLFGQPEDTTKVTYSEEIGDIEKQSFIEDFNHQSLSLPNYRHWVKIDFSDLFPRFVTPVDELPFAFSITSESRIKNKFSFNAFAGLSKERYSLSDASDGDYTPIAIFAGVEPRYFIKPKRTDDGRILENFNGSYIGLRYQLEYRDENSYADSILIKNAKPSIIHVFSIGYGLQYRIFEHGFFDFSFGLRYAGGNRPLPYLDETNTLKFRDGFSNTLLPYYRLHIGFALFPGKEKNGEVDKSASSRLFGYQIAEKSVFKINFLDVFKAGDYGLIYNKYKLKFDFGFEQKIIPPLSVSTNLTTTGVFFSPKKGIVSGDIFTSTIEAEIGTRYYYNLPKRIANGKSANNFSANYITVFSTYKHQQGFENFNNPKGYLIPDMVSVAVAYGLQRRIFKNGYIDYRIGTGVRIIDSPLERLFFLSELKLGFGF